MAAFPADAWYGVLHQNAARCADGAARMSMPPVPKGASAASLSHLATRLTHQAVADIFMDAVKQVVAANKDYIPPEGKVMPLVLAQHPSARLLPRAHAARIQGSLYLRPLLIGTGPILGLAPAPEYTFVIYASPVASYFKARARSRLGSLHVERRSVTHRPSANAAQRRVDNSLPLTSLLRRSTTAPRRAEPAAPSAWETIRRC